MANPDDIVAMMEQCTPYIASDIAEELNIPRTTADYHLRNLADEGTIRRKRHNQRRVTYWTESE